MISSLQQYIQGCYVTDLDHFITLVNGICLQKKGTLLSSTYVDSDEPLDIRCHRNHIFKLTHSELNKGHWCPQCIPHTKRTIEDMQSLAEQKNGDCLSPEYISSMIPLIWRCDKKHIWEARPIYIKRGNWCPICNGLRHSSRMGLHFESLCKQMFISLGHTGPGVTDKKLYYKASDSTICIPDFIINKTWYDAKLKPDTDKVDHMIEKYILYCNKLIIIYLYGEVHSTVDQITFQHIDDYYTDLETVGRYDLIHYFEQLKQGKIV